ncbi:hypothetical protein NE555_16760, partial [Alistipes onderdonkii]|uniref:hypothetical protein n=1 Tax=Alistipes onderdonkii TaxID=328813 RepID=UPI00210BB736
SPGEDGSGKVVFAVLAPKAWNLRDNATLYLTTKADPRPSVSAQRVKPRMPCSSRMAFTRSVSA